MVFLKSIHSGPDSIRSSFCGPNDLEDSTFALSVDEPVGGPVVIRVSGCIDKSTLAVFTESVSEAIVRGRSLVVDLLDVTFVDRPGMAILTVTANRLASHRCRAIIACTDALRSQLATGWKSPTDVECHRTLAAAIDAAMVPRHKPTDARTPPMRSSS